MGRYPKTFTIAEMAALSTKALAQVCLLNPGVKNSVMGIPSLAQRNGGLSLRPKSGRRSSEGYACNSCNLMKAEKLFSHELVFRAASRHMQAGFKCGASLKLARPPQKAPAKMGLEIRKRQRP